MRETAILCVCVFLKTFSGTACAQVGPKTDGTLPAVGQVVLLSSLPATVPFEDWNGLIVVKANLGEGAPMSAALHTGLPLCVIGPELAAKQFVRTEGVRDVPTLYGSLRASGAAPQSLRIGTLILKDVPCAVGDLFGHLSGQKRADAPPLWLGASALAAAVVTIDPRKQEVIFRPANSPLPRKATIVPFEIRDGRIVVEMKVNGKRTFPALVDTGVVGTLLPADAARDLKLPPAETLPVTHPNGKAAKVAAVDLKEVSIGGLKVNDVRAFYVAEGSVEGLDNEMGVLGNDILLRYRVTIHYGLRKIAFEKIADAPFKAAPAAQPNPVVPTAAPTGAPAPASASTSVLTPPKRTRRP